MTHTLFGTCGCGWHKHISNGLKSSNWFQLDIQIRIIPYPHLFQHLPHFLRSNQLSMQIYTKRAPLFAKSSSSKLSRPFLSQQNQQLRNVTLASSSNISLQPTIRISVTSQSGVKTDNSQPQLFMTAYPKGGQEFCFLSLKLRPAI